MKKISIEDSFKQLKLKVGDKVELYGRVWQYSEELRRDREPIRSLDPVGI